MPKLEFDVSGIDKILRGQKQVQQGFNRIQQTIGITQTQARDLSTTLQTLGTSSRNAFQAMNQAFRQFNARVDQSERDLSVVLQRLREIERQARRNQRLRGTPGRGDGGGGDGDGAQEGGTVFGVRRLLGGLTGIYTLQTAIRELTAEMRSRQEMVNRATDVQLDFEAARARLRRNMGNLTPEQRERIRVGAEAIAGGEPLQPGGERGFQFPLARVMENLARQLSSSGGDVEESLRLTALSMNMFTDNLEAGVRVAGAAQNVAGITGRTGRSALGLLLQIQGQAEAEGIGNVGGPIASGMIGGMGRGFTEMYSAALLSAVSRAVGDPEMRRTSTGVIGFAAQLQELQGADIAGQSTKDLERANVRLADAIQSLNDSVRKDTEARQREDFRLKESNIRLERQRARVAETERELQEGVGSPQRYVQLQDRLKRDRERLGDMERRHAQTVLEQGTAQAWREELIGRRRGDVQTFQGRQVATQQRNERLRRIQAALRGAGNLNEVVSLAQRNAEVRDFILENYQGEKRTEDTFRNLLMGRGNITQFVEEDLRVLMGGDPLQRVTDELAAGRREMPATRQAFAFEAAVSRIGRAGGRVLNERQLQALDTIGLMANRMPLRGQQLLRGIMSLRAGQGGVVTTEQALEELQAASQAIPELRRPKLPYGGAVGMGVRALSGFSPLEPGAQITAEQQNQLQTAVDQLVAELKLQQTLQAEADERKRIAEENKNANVNNGEILGEIRDGIDNLQPGIPNGGG